MKVVQINTVYGKGSTGKIVKQIRQECLTQGIENIAACRYREGEAAGDTLCVSTWLDCHAHNRLARYTHRAGFYSYFRTALFLRKLKKQKPDILHLHNLHGSYINIPLLFGYIRKHHVKVVWTFHDCWPFTGYCPYYGVYGCLEWKNGCKKCCRETGVLNRHSAERSLKQKRKLTEGTDLTIVTPSRWLADIVRQTFFSQMPVVTIPNGLDLEVFRPRESDFREKHGIPQDKFVVLGVAAVWEKRKGLDDFIELAGRLDHDTYQIVLVGTSETVDRMLPQDIISIHRTEDQIGLAKIYSASDVFVNPTKDEVLGMVNIEANACGIPVVTYRSGGSQECINENSGIVVDCDDVDALERAVARIRDTHPFSKEDCISCASRYDARRQFRRYVDLYNDIQNASDNTI
ncbi:MAG: glycosyltransferase [Clostridia bacterium]|nr:glycosyltransferase [Clostridia bacterium]